AVEVPVPADRDAEARVAVDVLLALVGLASVELDDPVAPAINVVGGLDDEVERLDRGGRVVGDLLAVLAQERHAVRLRVLDPPPALDPDRHPAELGDLVAV